MAETAAHLVDRVIPEVPTRQWVLSLPYSLRSLLGFDRRLCSRVLDVFLRVVLGFHRRRAKAIYGPHIYEGGAVTFIQRFGGALNLNPHFHSLLLDGVYRCEVGKLPRFLMLPPPTDGSSACVAI